MIEMMALEGDINIKIFNIKEAGSRDYLAYFLRKLLNSFLFIKSKFSTNAIPGHFTKRADLDRTLCYIVNIKTKQVAIVALHD